MSKKSRVTIPAILACSLLLNVVFVSCSADATRPTPAVQVTDPAILAQLTTIVQRLDSLEAQAERIEANTEAGSDVVVAALSDPDGELLTQMTDPDGAFLMGIGDAVSLSAGLGSSVCAEIGRMVGGEMSVGPSGEGGGKAQIGPNALEADAMVRAEGRLKVEGQMKMGLEAGLKASVCATVDLGLDLLTVGQDIQSQLETMGVTGGAISTLIGGVQPPASLNYTNVRAAVETALPVSSGLRSVFDNPGSIITDSPSLREYALDVQCSPSFLPAGIFSDAQDRLCTLIPSIPPTEDYIGILNGLRGLPATVSSLSSDLSSVCGTVNTIRNRDDFSIPVRNTPISLGPYSGTFTTFPGYSRSFATVPAAC